MKKLVLIEGWCWCYQMAWCREGAREEDRDMKKKAMEEAHGSARGGTTQRSAIECVSEAQTRGQMKIQMQMI